MMNRIADSPGWQCAYFCHTYAQVGFSPLVMKFNAKHLYPLVTHRLSEMCRCPLGEEHTADEEPIVDA
jgi:hypothetical protein